MTAAGTNGRWPVLKTYDENHLARIAMPLGGIGTGTVSLGGRGDLRDWEIINRPAKGYVPAGSAGRGLHPFFALRVQSPGEEPVARALEGPLDLSLYEGGSGSPTPNHGLPRFRHCRFHAAYPLAQVELSDTQVPVSVHLEAFNPMIPGDPDRSGVPVAILRYELRNRSDQAVTATVCGNVPNFIGADGSQTEPAWGGVGRATGASDNRNSFRKGKGARGIAMSSRGVDPKAETWGTMALATTAGSGISHRTDWAHLSWGDSLLDFWDDLLEDGALDLRDAPGCESPMASLAVRMKIPARETRQVTFILAWHFPNRGTWTPEPTEGADACCGAAERNRIGNYYTTQYADAWDVAERTARDLKKLEADTVQFVRAFLGSDLPEVVKEAALFNLSTLRTQTCFRTPDGTFWGWEGCHDHGGCCQGSCTHVWNYEQATAFLYGSLAQTMRRVEFGPALHDNGLMCFRAHLPIARAGESGTAAADGQMGCIMKVYRDWQLSGDDGMLRELWPNVRKALEFAWIKGGWDADRDGVMEGCQHNTMDVEYYGPNPQMEAWYLGALAAAEAMARYLHDDAFAVRCRDLRAQGKAWTDAELFNGHYYEHRIQPATGKVAKGLRVGMGAADAAEPEMQLGAGCLVDQLVGQYMSHVCGLGYLLDRSHVRATLRSILKHNFKKPFHGHFNHMRSYVLGDEGALLMASYPLGRRPKRPFPYYNEVMTGFEYTAAVHMLYEGQVEAGLRVIEAIRDRYDGHKRSPFNEAECGHHYARAMTSWAAVLALSGFRYSGVTKEMRFAERAGSHFWSTGHAWGTCDVRRVGDGHRVTVKVLHGRLALRQVGLGKQAVALDKPKALRAGASITVRVD